MIHSNSGPTNHFQTLRHRKQRRIRLDLGIHYYNVCIRAQLPCFGRTRVRMISINLAQCPDFIQHFIGEGVNYYDFHLANARLWMRLHSGNGGTAYNLHERFENRPDLGQGKLENACAECILSVLALIISSSAPVMKSISAVCCASNSRSYCRWPHAS